MSKLSNREKLILSFIITNCEIYRLNENVAMKYIQDKLPRPISRRTYYNYKNQMYKNHEKNSPSFGLFMNPGFGISRNLISLSLISYMDEIIEKGLKEKIKPEEFDRLDYYPQCLEVLYTRSETMIEHTSKVLNRMESRRQLVNKNHESIPDNATVRKEYVKCGKYFCYGCPHGPYYYAYWKDENRKLRKKYIGTYNPRKAEDGSKNTLEHILSKQDNSFEDFFQE